MRIPNKLTGLIYWYSFDDAPSSLAVDPIGMTVAATSNVSATNRLPLSYRNRAYLCNGSNSQILTTPSLAIPLDFTYSIWVNPSASQSAYTGIIVAPGANAPTLYLKSTLQLAWYTDGGARSQDPAGTAVLVAGRWNHIAWAVTHSSSSVLYLNGVQIATVSGASAPATGGTQRLSIGYDQSNAGRILNGGIADFRVYKRQISQAEVLQIYLEAFQPVGVDWIEATPVAVAPSTIKFRRTLSHLGTRIGARQVA